MIFCCISLFQLIKNKVLRLNYDKSMRIYLLSCVSNSGCQTLFYCFCCGKKFPKDLWDTWYSILTEEYKIKDLWEAKYEGKLT
jgi:S-ribosylhomocysteine lyase LuxS involved in autoinducer biosynthesis